jgi:phage-related tail fiber protein
MAFKSIHTNYGLSRLSSAEATGTPINLTHMAVGDGAGNPVTPVGTQTGLVREMYRSTVSRVYQDPDDPKLFTAELIVPASVSGFTMREVAVFDDAGGLFVVGNLPDTYKPHTSEGAFADAIVRLQFYVSNASVVTLVLDPNVANVSQTWIINNITPAFLLPGGTTHQVLRKKSNIDGDTEWADPTEVNVTVNAIEDPQTLAANQTVVDWVLVTNDGLAVYIEGVRLRADQFTKHPTINTRITLAQSYPAGTKIVGVQNEPAGTLVDPLEQAQNLADVPNKAAARTNLDVYSKAEVNSRGKAAGEVFYTARSTAPSGSLKANGAAVSRTAYAALFAAIGTTFGAGDGVNTFNLPDLRGEFIRGLDDGRGVDPDRVLGSSQNASRVLVDWYSESSGRDSIADGGLQHADADMEHNSVVNVHTGVETKWTGSDTGTHVTRTWAGRVRVRNVAMLPCIQFQS